MNAQYLFKTVLLFSVLLLVTACDTVQKEAEIKEEEFVLETPQESSFSTSENLFYTPISNLWEYVGGGYDSLTKDFKGMAITPNTIAIHADTSVIVKRGYVFVEDSLSVPRFLDEMIHSLHSEKNYSLSLFNKEQLGSFVKNNEVVSLAVVTFVRHHDVSLSIGEMSENAKSVLSLNDLNKFERMYGNSFCSDVLLGGYQVVWINAHYGLHKAQISEASLRKALWVKFKELNNLETTEEEVAFMNDTLNQTLVSYSLMSTVPVLHDTLVADEKSFIAADSSFFAYYENPIQGLAVIAKSFSSYNLLKDSN